MADIKEQVQAKSISQTIDESALGRALAAYNKYGYDSIEFKQAEIDYKLECAISEAKYQATRARNKLIWDA